MEATLSVQLDDWDAYDIDVEEAEQVRVPFGIFQTPRSLKWFIDTGRADYLDELLDKEEPGTLLFFALTLVCERYEDEIAAALDQKMFKEEGKPRVRVIRDDPDQPRRERIVDPDPEGTGNGQRPKRADP